MLKHLHTYTFICEESLQRLDMFLMKQFPECTRNVLQNLIRNGHVTLNAKIVTKTGYSLQKSDIVEIKVPEIKEIHIAPEKIKNITAIIIFQSESFAIIEKPAGLMTHKPQHQSQEPTLVDWLQITFKDIDKVGYLDRPGIVHRLDKDTSGLMIIPLTAQAHATFSKMFKDRKIHKTYTALVEGHPEKNGIIELPLGRNPKNRCKMAHIQGGRPATTKYNVIQYFKEYALIEAHPITGRTHQIRVHCSTLGHPLVGDALYGKASTLIKRHALHASALEFEFEGKKYSFTSEIPHDIHSLITMLL